MSSTVRRRHALPVLVFCVAGLLVACDDSQNNLGADSAGAGSPPGATTEDEIAPDPVAGSPEWYVREASNFLASQQRGIDRALQGSLLPVDADPLRVLNRWSPVRGEALETSFENRYGAKIAVTMFRPLGDRARPLPSVVIIPGFGQGVRSAYYFLAEDLAEHGYLVMVFDPQNQGASEANGRPETCVPGDWQAPQEMGLREQGKCAGQPPASASDTDVLGTESLLSHMVLGTDADHASTAVTYNLIAPTFVLGALDATAWLLSGANPWRAWVDATRIGLAGHSAGAYGAAQAANGDPHHRFRAAVALDGYHPIDHGVMPRVPTLFILSEQEQAPRLAPPQNPRTLHPTWESFDAFRAAGVASGHLILRSSSHLDFSDAAGLASRYGSRYASYYTLAWFDAFLKSDPDAAGRFTAVRFDDSVDVSSIGTGGFNSSGGNQPPMIEGQRLRDSYSYYYPGALAAFGLDCQDPRCSRCAPP